MSNKREEIPIAVIKDEVSAIYSPPSTATTKSTVITAQQVQPIKATPLETEKMKNDLLSLQDTIQKLKQQDYNMEIQRYNLVFANFNYEPYKDIGKEDLIRRSLIITQKYISECDRNKALEDKICELEELIKSRSNGIRNEEDLMKIIKEQKPKILKKQEQVKNLPKYQETITNQEEIINKLQKVLENEISKEEEEVNKRDDVVTRHLETIKALEASIAQSSKTNGEELADLHFKLMEKRNNLIEIKNKYEEVVYIYSIYLYSAEENDEESIM